MKDRLIERSESVILKTYVFKYATNTDCLKKLSDCIEHFKQVDPTQADFKETCKKFDKDIEQLRAEFKANPQPPEVNANPSTGPS